MNLAVFSDGSTPTCFVGKKSLYDSKEEFLADCLFEFDYVLEDYLTEEEWNMRDNFSDASLVYEDYCRYYNKMPEDASYLDLDSGYLLGEKKGNGAFEVYVIDIGKLVNNIKKMD